jgi:nucleoid-associated protein YgaU
MVSQEFEQGFGEQAMPSDVHEKTPGVYVRAENELPHELDMLWSNSKAYQREDRSPIISFIAGLLVGAVLTAAVFMLFFSHPQAPVSESVTPAATGKGGGILNTAEPATRAAGPAANTTYKVVSGDTLGRIAEKVYGSSAPKYIDKIQHANGMSSPNNLQIGQTLIIPPKEY